MHCSSDGKAGGAEEKAALSFSLLRGERTAARCHVERAEQRQDHCGSGEAARGGVWVHEEQRGSGNWERQPAGQ